MLGFLFYERELNLGSEMGKIKLQKNLGDLLDKLRKYVVHKWNGYLELFSLP